MKSDLISESLLNERVENILKEAGSPEAGLFGPESITWRINRHSALFAGSWRAALLQLAHPWVAQSLEDHSNMHKDPVSRFHRTFRVVFAMVFGSTDQVRQVSRALFHLHESIKGTMKTGSAPYASGQPYQANQKDAVIWVLATLWDTALLVYDRLVQPLSGEEREAYYQEGKKFAALFGISEDDLPPDWVAFQAYFDEAIASGTIQVTATARRLGHFLFEAPQVPLHFLWEQRARHLTYEWMPETLRKDFGFPPPSCATWKTYTTEVRRIRGLYRALPPRLRYVPPYFEAQRRIRGKERVDLLTRWGNQLWIGQPTLLAPASSR